MRYALVGVWFALMTAAHVFAAAPKELRCEGSIDPTGVETKTPRLSWLLSAPADARGVRQSAYQILAASDLDRLTRDEGDLWDSGKTAGDDFVGIAYAGKSASAGQPVFWKVRTWDGVGVASSYSESARWIAGLSSPVDWHDAKWIGVADSADDTLRFRRSFDVAAGVRRATLFVTGLGQYEASLNGTPIGDGLLSPGWTAEKKTILYETFDVTAQLKPGGENAIGITLAGGMHRLKPTKGRYVKFTRDAGPLQAIALLQLEFADGRREYVVTDRRWQRVPSPITYSNVFGGEDFDARLETPGWNAPGFDASKVIGNAAELDPPGGTLRGHDVAAPPIRAIETHTPIKTMTPRPNVTIYDLGQNASHMPRLVVHGPAGSRVRVIPSELLGRDGLVDRQSCVQDAGGPAWWQYTLAGSSERGEEKYFSHFFYQGARYFQVELFPATEGGELPTVDEITGVVIHSAAEPIGTFECSSDLFNRIYSLVRWAQRSNMMSLMTDCPQREKLGWLEELHLNGPALRYNFRLDRLYAKQLNDMADAQLAGGLVPNIAPEYFLAHTAKLDDPFRNSVEWGSSFIIAAWQQYEFTGDDSLIRQHYDAMLKYHAFLAGMAKGEIIEHGLGDWYDIGPKPPWGSQLTPPPFTATAIYFYDTRLLGEMAKLLGRADDAKRFADHATKIRAAFNTRFYDNEKHHYATGSQCTSAMPLVLGLVEDANRPAVLQALIDDIRKRGNALSAGDVGYRFVLRALADAGRSDVIFDMNNQSERPGYGMQLARGATALTEKWDASVGNFGSQNHFMLGQINEWLFHDLAGIQCDPATPGFRKIVIHPALVGDLTRASATYTSVRGKIASTWTRNAAGVTLDVTIPPGTSATVYVPADDATKVMEGGRPAAQVDGVKLIRVDGGESVFGVTSGNFSFRVPSRRN